MSHAYAMAVIPFMRAASVDRSAAMGLSSWASRLGAMSASPMMLLSQYGQAIPYLIFGVTAAAAAVSCRLLPETRGRSMPETIADAIALSYPPGAQKAGSGAKAIRPTIELSNIAGAGMDESSNDCAQLGQA